MAVGITFLSRSAMRMHFSFTAFFAGFTGAGNALAVDGLLEARLTGSDRVILGGLVESVWPPATRTDPWLSRPMRHDLGLDLPERLTAQPEEVASAIVKAVERHRDTIYVRPVWRLIMTIIRNVPESIFKKTKL